jgi:hypothetical protein
LNAVNFNNSFDPAGVQPIGQLFIQLNEPEPINISLFTNGQDSVLHSSQNYDAYFADSNGLAARIFKMPQDFADSSD